MTGEFPDPEPMWDEVVGRHAYLVSVCARMGCALRPREGFTRARAAYPQVPASVRIFHG